MRLRPKSDYLHTASWESLYVLGEHWKSDIQFYKDELRFLTDLIAKYFIWMTREENIADVKKLSADLIHLTDEYKSLGERVDHNLHQLSLLMENAFSQDEQQFRNEHEKLEDDLEEDIKKFRVLKKEIFEFTEHVIDSERIQHLLTT